MYLIIICLFFLYSCTVNEEISICFTGDVLLDRGMRTKIVTLAEKSQFEGVDLLFHSSDYTVINLECPVTKQSTPINKKYIFRGEPEWLKYFKNAGITHTILANNHINDQDRRGVTSTIENLNKYNIIPIGAGLNQTEACSPVFIKLHNSTIAIFAAVRVILENWMYLEELPGPCQASTDDLCEEIKKLKKNHPGIIIITSLHWGIEYRQIPHLDQRMAAHELINAGADIIIGHHPHVVQTIEIFKGKAIFYSLGNFIFDSTPPISKKSIIVRLRIRENHTEEIQIYPVKIKHYIPYIMDKQESKTFLKDIRLISPAVSITMKNNYWELKN